MTWTATWTSTWLSISNWNGSLGGIGGTIAAGVNVSNIVYFTSSATNLPNGTYLDAITWSNKVNNQGTTITPVSLTITNSSVVPNPFVTWQNYYFGCTGCPQAQPNANPSGNGVSNTNQFMAGFNPTNAAAYLHVINIARTNNNTDIRVTYLGASGDSSYTGGPTSRTNVLEFTAGTTNGSYTNNFVSTGQTNILSGGTGLGVVTNMVDSGGATNKPSRFYRVRVLLP